MNNASPADEVAKAHALQRIRRIATGVLLALVAVFLATYSVDEPSDAVLLIRKMAEAGMIGGLADWFAVEALFRHPLGLKIPHTALLPANQQRAAKNVGRFFETYFLEPEQLQARINDLQPARRAAEWLQDRDHARLIAGHLTSALAVVLNRAPPRKMVAKLREQGREILSAPEADEALTQAVVPALRNTLSGDVITSVIDQVRATIDARRESVADAVQERSRWWVASAVDKRISGVLVDGILSLLEDLSKEGSEARLGFEKAMGSLLEKLEDNGALNKAIARGKNSFIESGAFDKVVDKLAGTVHARLRDGVEQNPDEMTDLLADALQGFGRRLLDDPDALERFEARLSDGAREALVELRGPISGYVTEVIAGWDAKTLSDRFESEIGPDLQYIRINGAVLGALIGGALFFIERGLA